METTTMVNIINTVTIMGIITTLTRIIDFYREGFVQMRVGKRLWGIIAIKLLIMFGVLKLFFFPNVLEERYADESSRSEHVLKHLTKEKGVWKE